MKANVLLQIAMMSLEWPKVKGVLLQALPSDTLGSNRILYWVISRQKFNPNGIVCLFVLEFVNKRHENLQ